MTDTATAAAETPAATETVQTTEPAQTPEQVTEGFATGYNRAKGLEQPEKTEATADTKTEPEKKSETTEPAKTEPAVVEPVKVLGFTEAELRAELGKTGAVSKLVEKEISKVYGKIGEIGRTIQTLQQGLATSKTGRKITPEALKRVNEELPGLGTALAQDLTEILGGAEAAQAAAEGKGQIFDADKYHAEKIAPALAEMQARIVKAKDEATESAQSELLTYMHPDYEVFIKSDTFKSWLQTQPADRRKEVVTTPRAVVAGKAIAEAKQWAEAKKKEAAKAKSKLDAAIPATKGGAAAIQQAPDASASFRRGYTRARGR